MSVRIIIAWKMKFQANVFNRFSLVVTTLSMLLLWVYLYHNSLIHSAVRICGSISYFAYLYALSRTYKLMLSLEPSTYHLVPLLEVFSSPRVPKSQPLPNRYWTAVQNAYLSDSDVKFCEVERVPAYALMVSVVSFFWWSSEMRVSFCCKFATVMVF